MVKERILKMLKRIPNPKQYSWIIHFATMQLETDPHRSPFHCAPAPLHYSFREFSSSLCCSQAFPGTQHEYAKPSIIYFFPLWVVMMLLYQHKKKMIQVDNINNTSATLDVPNTFPPWSAKCSPIYWLICLFKRGRYCYRIKLVEKHKGLSHNHQQRR